MHTTRDTQLKMKVRQQAWLRLEHWRRYHATLAMLTKMLLRGLYHDASLSLKQRALVRIGFSHISRRAGLTKHATRCRVSGRVHQTNRYTQLARMHCNQSLAEGRLLGYRLGRR